MSEIRDTAPPYEPSRAEGTTLWPPVQHDLMHANPQPPTYLWWVWLVIVIGIVMGAIGIASAAEPGTRPYEITLLFKGADYDAVERTHRVLATYGSKTECEVMITRVRVEVKGARLRCDPVETRRVR